jgi:hypothetical protein
VTHVITQGSIELQVSRTPIGCRYELTPSVAISMLRNPAEVCKGWTNLLE